MSYELPLGFFPQLPVTVTGHIDGHQAYVSGTTGGHIEGIEGRVMFLEGGELITPVEQTFSTHEAWKAFCLKRGYLRVWSYNSVKLFK